MSALNKLSELRATMEKGFKPDEARELRQIDLRIKALNDYQELAQRPGISELLQWCRRGIGEINETLSTDRELLKDGREGERLAMLEKKDILLYLTGLFNPQAELDEIEKELSDRVEVFKEYQEGR